MGKPDPADGSLESILASIRKSLSEQSTDALSETSVAPVELDKAAKPSRKRGLTQRLAGTTAEASSSLNAEPAGDDLSDLLEEPAGKALPASEATPTTAAEPAASSSEKDPLWFLTRREEPSPEAEAPPLSAAAAPEDAGAQAPAPEPKLTRPEVLRASMPPFFGSSAEIAKPASAPAEAAIQAASASQATRPQTATPVAPVAQPDADAAIAREVSLVAAAVETAATRPVQVPPQVALNGKGPAASVPSPDTILAGNTPYNRALEAMVLDLLKPMLSKWLDENMPRLVAEALEEEVRRTRAGRDAKKT